MADYSKYDRHIYQFLLNNNDWIKKADKNADDIVICSEFTSYLGEKMDAKDWDGENLSSSNEKDILASFFSRILDTNKSSGAIKGHKNLSQESALDINEQKSISKKMEKYGEILDKIQGKCPSYIKNEKEWEHDVVTEVFNTYGEDFSINNVDFNNIFKKVTGRLLVEEYFKDLKSSGCSLFGVNYDPVDDSILQNLLNSYLTLKTTEKFNKDTLQNDIMSIVNQYLSFAGIVDKNSSNYSSDIDIEKLNPSIINEKTFTNLQQALSINKLGSLILEKNPKYKNYKNLFEKALNDFVNNAVSTGIIPSGSWENKDINWNDIATKFENSRYKIDLDKAIAELENVGSTDEEDNNSTTTSKATSKADEIYDSKVYDDYLKYIESYNTIKNTFAFHTFLYLDQNSYHDQVISMIDKHYNNDAIFANIVDKVFGKDYSTSIKNTSMYEVGDKINNIETLYFETFVKELQTLLEKSYKEELSKLGLTALEKDEIFELAKNLTIVPTVSIVFCNDFNPEIIVEHYSNIITDMLNDNNAKNYYLNNDYTQFKINGHTFNEIMQDGLSSFRITPSTKTFTNLSEACSEARGTVNSFIDNILSGFTVEGYVPESISNAAQKTKAYYEALLNAIASRGRFSQEEGSITISNEVGTDPTSTYTSIGENFTIQVDGEIFTEAVWWNGEKTLDEADDMFADSEKISYFKVTSAVMFASNDTQTEFKYAIDLKALLFRFTSYI